MGQLGIVLVSHSKDLAKGIANLVSEVAKNIPFTFVGGTEDGGVGSSFDQVMKIVTANPADDLLAFYDLGSARMNLELVAELAEKNLQIQDVAVVEGVYTAAALLAAGADKEVILEQVSALAIKK